MRSGIYYYNKAHRLSFTIGSTTYDTWNTWGLLPVEKAVPVAPSVRTDSGAIKVSYADGSVKTLLISNAGTGAAEGTADFIITSDTPDTTFSTIVTAIHGKRGTITFLDSNQTYTGLFSVSSYAAQDKYSVISIRYELYSSGDVVAKSSITDALAHGVTFTVGNVAKKTWTDWEMICETPVAIAAPAVKTNYIPIPGANGSIDLSQALAGHILYDNVSGQITFDVTGTTPLTTYYAVMTHLHGMKGTMTPADGGGTFTGRFSVDGYSVSDGQFKITIGYNVIPYINRGS